MNADAVNALHSFVLEKMQGTHMPGLSVSVIERGKVHLHRAFGFRDLETRQPVTSRTIFGLGSITKVFTAIAILQLHDRGILDLNDRLDRYLDIDLMPFGQPIRIWHLLSHSSGIPALGLSESKMSTDWFMSGIPVATEEDLFAFLDGVSIWAACEPGRRWYYLNEGYLLLGQLIAHLSGQPYTEYIEQHILAPLQMERTRFSRTRRVQDKDAATPYMRGRDGDLFVGAALYGEMPAAGGLASCAQDMSRFAEVLLHEGSFPNGGQLLTADSLRQMQTPRIPLPQEPAEIDCREPDAKSGTGEHPKIAAAYQGYFGCGLQIYRNFYGFDLMAHGGGIMGGTSYLAYLPECGLAIVLLANAHGYPLGQMAMVFLAQLLGKNYVELPFVQIDRALEPLVGSYESFRSTILAEVTREGDLLRFTIRYNHEHRSSILVPLCLGEDHLRFETFSGGRRMEVDFYRNERGIDVLFERYKFRRRD